MPRTCAWIITHLRRSPGCQTQLPTRQLRCQSRRVRCNPTAAEHDAVACRLKCAPVMRLAWVLLLVACEPPGWNKHPPADASDGDGPQITLDAATDAPAGCDHG